jgi:hypothetical protein
MDRLAVWVLVGLLAYICFILTSIDSKLEADNQIGVRYAVLNSSQSQGLGGEAVQQISMAEEAKPLITHSSAGFTLIAMISVFLSWHFSRIYHSHEWTKAILKKRYAYYTEPYRPAQPAQPLHPDQDCVSDPVPADGRIRKSWLPANLQRLDAEWQG